MKKGEQKGNLAGVSPVASELPNSVKLAVLAELLGGITHEINNSLSIIQMASEQIQELLDAESASLTGIFEMNQKISEGASCINKVLQGLRSCIREGRRGHIQSLSISQVVKTSILLCHDRLRQAKVSVKVPAIPDHIQIECNPLEASCRFLDAIDQACNAVQSSEKKWIEVIIQEGETEVEIFLKDSRLSNDSSSQASSVIMKFPVAKLTRG